MLAQEEARRLGHNFVGTEQILLGLIGEGTGIAAKVLKSMGVNLKEARVEVEKIIGRGSGFVAVEIPFTPRAKRVLELSLEEARQLGKTKDAFARHYTGRACSVPVKHVEMLTETEMNHNWYSGTVGVCCCYGRAFREGMGGMTFSVKYTGARHSESCCDMRKSGAK